jgi:hypothetical protein
MELGNVLILAHVDNFDKLIKFGLATHANNYPKKFAKYHTFANMLNTYNIHNQGRRWKHSSFIAKFFLGVFKKVSTAC